MEVLDRFSRRAAQVQREMVPGGQSLQARRTRAIRMDGCFVSILQFCRRAFLAFLLISCPNISRAQDDVTEIQSYHGAVSYCRTHDKTATTISPDRKVVCFDGRTINKNVDISVVQKIRDGGLFVVTGFGGESRSAIAAAELLRERSITVVIYDYCLLSCSDYFFVASKRTYVVEQSLVVWQYFLEKCTVTLRILTDFDLPKVWRADCPTSTKRAKKPADDAPMISRFYSGRAINAGFLWPPDSPYVRKRLKSLYDQTGIFPGIAWTLSPRHVRSLFTTDITFEAYPRSQAEATSIANRFRVRDVIYDP